MPDIEELRTQLDEAKCTLEELMECGDLEDELEAVYEVARLEKLLAKAENHDRYL